MAEPAFAIDNNWQTQQMVSDSLRQKKMEQFNNAQMLKSQAIGSNFRINDRLMSRQSSQNQADEQAPTETKNLDQSNSESGNIVDSLKQAKQVAKLAANPTIAGAAMVVAEEAAKALNDGSAAKLLTGGLLSASWKGLIPSWGLTLGYLNLHAWAGFVEGHKIFCKLGEEFKISSIFKAALGFWEAVAILLIDFLVVITILAILSLLILIVDAMTHPIQNFQILWDLFGGNLDALRPQ